MRNIAVILAGGTGSRMGLPMPKQFMLLSGRAVIEYSIDTFDSHPAVDEVAVVVHPDWRGRMEEIASAGHHAVEHRADVAIGEEEHVLAVAFGGEVFGVDLHHVEV